MMAKNSFMLEVIIQILLLVQVLGQVPEAHEFDQ